MDSETLQMFADYDRKELIELILEQQQTINYLQGLINEINERKLKDSAQVGHIIHVGSNKRG